MGRKAIYTTIEEKRRAQCEASKRHKEKMKLKNKGEEPLPKTLPKSYSKEYHQQRYQAMKLAKSNHMELPCCLPNERETHIQISYPNQSCSSSVPEEYEEGHPLRS